MVIYIRISIITNYKVLNQISFPSWKLFYGNRREKIKYTACSQSTNLNLLKSPRVKRRIHCRVNLRYKRNRHLPQVLNSCGKLFPVLNSQYMQLPQSMGFSWNDCCFTKRKICFLEGGALNRQEIKSVTITQTHPQVSNRWQKGKYSVHSH